MNILDIVNNLENKLNIALENEIAQKIQNEQFTPLFNGRETFRFKLFLDTANYMGYDYLKRFSTDTEKPGTFDERDLSNTPKNNLVRYINGVISGLADYGSSKFNQSTPTSYLFFYSSFHTLYILYHIHQAFF